MNVLAAEGGYQDFELLGGEWAVLYFSLAAALLALAVGFVLMKGVLAGLAALPTAPVDLDDAASHHWAATVRAVRRFAARTVITAGMLLTAGGFLLVAHLDLSAGVPFAAGAISITPVIHVVIAGAGPASRSRQPGTTTHLTPGSPAGGRSRTGSWRRDPHQMHHFRRETAMITSAPDSRRWWALALLAVAAVGGRAASVPRMVMRARAKIATRAVKARRRSMETRERERTGSCRVRK